MMYRIVFTLPGDSIRWALNRWARDEKDAAQQVLQKHPTATVVSVTQVAVQGVYYG